MVSPVGVLQTQSFILGCRGPPTPPPWKIKSLLLTHVTLGDSSPLWASVS